MITNFVIYKHFSRLPHRGSGMVEFKEEEIERDFIPCGERLNLNIQSTSGKGDSQFFNWKLLRGLIQSRAMEVVIFRSESTNP